jgi:hypothetical protein
LQVEVQTPPAHAFTSTLLLAHGRPQAPQLFGSPEVLVSQPLSGEGAAGWGPQLPKPGVQVEVQRPPEHALVATFVFEQGRPHPPQLSMFAETLTSQPSSGVGGDAALQSPNPTAQVGAHFPALHAVEATFCEPH